VNLAIGVDRRYLTDLTIQRFYFLFATSQLLNFFFQLITLCNWCCMERRAFIAMFYGPTDSSP
jgi:hypothetical protein